MTARWLAFAFWAAAAATAVFWGLKLFVPGARPPEHTTIAATAAAPRGDLRRIFGSDPVVPVVVAEEPAPSSRFQLVGVVAPRDARAREGVALIAVDGKTPKAYRIGAPVDGDLVLQSVRARGATLGTRNGGANVSLDIPPPQPAATGMLPPSGMAATMPPPQFQPLPGGAVRPGQMPTMRLPQQQAGVVRPAPAPIRPQQAQQAQQAQPLQSTEGQMQPGEQTSD
jgi:general secretion pathway protein C